MILHFRMRRRLSLLAAGALAGPELEQTLAHVEACGRCREELLGLRGVLTLVASDPVRGAEPPVRVSSLLTRVHARLGEDQRPARPWWLLLPVAAAAALAMALLVPRGGPEPVAQMPEAALDRLEANVARQQTARYLSDAGDVLVTVTTLPQECDREKERLDVAAESERSRRLLARRALLVDAERSEVASVRPVLEDVEDMLREVASLESCVRRRDVERVRAEVERRQLLMKIRLMTRELEG